MKSFIEYITESPKKAGGMAAGKHEIENLTSKQARKLRPDVIDQLEDFDSNYKKAKDKLLQLQDIDRKDMPVVASWQIPEFKKFLTSKGIGYRESMVDVGKLHPTQMQIYFDVVFATGFDMYGIPDQSNVQTTKTIVASKDYEIIDGHHRWMYFMMTDPKIKVKTLAVNLPLKELMKVSFEFMDVMGNVRNESL